MTKRLLIALFLFFYTTLAFAQKDKLPKSLKTDWILEYSIYADETRKTTLNFQTDKLIWKGEPYRTMEFEDYEYEEEKFENDTTQGIQDEYTGTLEQESDEFTILKHWATSSTSGKIIAEYNDYGYTSFVALSYQNLNKNTVNIYLEYQLRTLQEAESKILSKDFHSPDKEKIFWSKSLYATYEKYPAILLSDKNAYNLWWDSYLEELKKPEIQAKLKEKKIVPGLYIMDNDYFSVSILQNLFIKKSYHPNKSMASLRNAIVKFGLDEEIRRKIRGEYTSDERNLIKKKLQKVWYSFPMMYEFGGGDGSLVTKLGFDNNLLTLEQAPFPGMEEVKKEVKKEDFIQAVVASKVEIPIIDFIKGMNINEGFVVVGPFPDTMIQDNKKFAILSYNNLEEQTTNFTFGDVYETQEEALNSPMRFSVFANLLFIEEEKIKAELKLPTIVLKDESDVEKIMAEIKNLGNNPDNNLDPMNQMLLYQYLSKKGYNPFKSIQLIQKFNEIKYKKENIQSIRENIKYYENELNNTQDSASKASYELSIESESNRLALEMLEIEIFELEMKGTSTELQQKKNTLATLQQYNSIVQSIEDYKYKKDDLFQTRTILKDIDKTTEYFQSDYDYYKERYELEFINYPKELEEQYLVIQKSIKEFESNNNKELTEKLNKKLKDVVLESEEIEKELELIKTLLDELGK